MSHKSSTHVSVIVWKTEKTLQLKLKQITIHRKIDKIEDCFTHLALNAIG